MGEAKTIARKTHNEAIVTKPLPLFICRDLGTFQFVCRDNKLLAAIFVIKTWRNIQGSRDRQTELNNMLVKKSTLND